MPTPWWSRPWHVLTARYEKGDGHFDEVGQDGRSLLSGGLAPAWCGGERQEEVRSDGPPEPPGWPPRPWLRSGATPWTSFRECHRRGGRHRRLHKGGRRGNRQARRWHRGHSPHPGRQRLPRWYGPGLRGVLRALLGTVQGTHQTSTRKSRVPHRRGLSLLRLLR